MKRVTDVIETVNNAIGYVQQFPCVLCQYENSRTGECRAGVKYKGTCPVYRNLTSELLKLRKIKEKQK